MRIWQLRGEGLGEVGGLTRLVGVGWQRKLKSEARGFERSGTGMSQCFSGREGERELSWMKFKFLVKTEVSS